MEITVVIERMLKNGGAEIFLRSLAHLLPIRQGICTKAKIFDPEFAASFPFPFKVGTEHVQPAIDDGDLILTWGHTELNKIVTRKPRICVFNGCNASARYQLEACNEVVNYVICSSTHVKSDVAFDYPNTLIHPGIDPDRLIVTNDVRKSLGLQGFIVGMTSRFDWQKRQEWLVQAVTGLPVTALFVGDGPDLSHIKSIAPPNCVFVGHQEDIGNYYACMDAFCLPSTVEGCSASLFEAMFMKLPVIVTPVGSAPDLMNGKNGWIVHNPFDIRQAITVLQDKQHALAMGEAAFATANKKGHIRETARRWKELFERLEKEGIWKPFI